MTTPAQRAGIVYGKIYKVGPTSERTNFIGRTITLATDDGSDNPWFHVEGDERHRCFQVKDIVPANGSGKLKGDYTVVVAGEHTTFTFERRLTQAQVAAILAAVEV